MAQAQEDLSIISLRGGMNDTDPPHALADDQCVLAENVEWFYSTLGERRAGCEPVLLTSSGLTSGNVVVHLSQWFSSNLVTAPEWWAISAVPGTSVYVAKNQFTTWVAETPGDAIDTSVPDLYYIDSQPLNGLLFWSYHSAQNRLHLWDGTSWRRTGLAQPVAPTAVDNGVGAYATTRYFRIRYVEVNVASQVIRRSEPSLALTFIPSGGGTGARISRPALLSEGETHWEVEASIDNASFYQIARIAKATTTYDDTTAYATGYTALGPISEVIGTYLLQQSAKYLAVDGDRLLLGGHWTDPSLQSTIWWTPVSNDPGVGNGERIPLQVNNSVNLDGYEGGPLTGISSAVYGTWFAFKWSHIYQMVRTGDVLRAYQVTTLSKSHGALPGTIVEGADEHGNPCVYFLDPVMGPCRLGNSGLQTIEGLRKTWGRVNLLADVVGHGVYYPYKRQVHWWVAVDGSTIPNYKIVLQVSAAMSQGGAVSRGWSVATGRVTEAYTSEILSEQVFQDGVQILVNRPFIGLTSPDYIQRCDTDTTDAGHPYVATIRTKPYILAGLLNKWGAMVASLLATAYTDAQVVVRLLRDYGVEESEDVTVDFTPAGSEEFVVRKLGNLRMSGAATIQIEFSDE